MAKEVSQARIAVIGAGLMGHGIAQVFALAGHDVTITDTVMKNLDTVTKRIAANLRDLGDDPLAIARIRPCLELAEAVREADYVVEAVARGSAAQAEAVRRDRTSRAGRSDPCQQHLGHTDHLDHGGVEKPRARAGHPLVESAVPGAARRSDRDAMDLARGRRLDHGIAPGRRQEAGARQEGRAGLHRQPAAARAMARSDLARRKRHLRCGDRRCGDQSLVRAAACGARPAGKRRSRRHRSDARHPQYRAAGDRQPAGRVALSGKAGGRRQARVQIRRRLSQMERRRAGGAARQSAAAPESVARQLEAIEPPSALRHLPRALPA